VNMDAEKLRSKPKHDFPKSETWAARLNDCAAMLAVHGFLTDEERIRIHRRILNALKQKGES